jgi:hypothetical protein
MNSMPAADKLEVLDLIELAEPHDGIPAGATGGLLELMDHGAAMVEITSLPELDAVERIIFPPLTKLRRIGHVATKPPDLMELTESFDGIPAGATGNLVGFKGASKAIVEITSIPGLDEERIISPPLAKLRRIGAVRSKPKDVAA